jgi:hypothetical protein
MSAIYQIALATCKPKQSEGRKQFVNFSKKADIFVHICAIGSAELSYCDKPKQLLKSHLFYL